MKRAKRSRRDTCLTSERRREVAGTAEANARATALLAREVQKQAYVLSFIDGFMVLGFAVFVALLLILFLRDPPAQSASVSAPNVNSERATD